MYEEFWGLIGYISDSLILNKEEFKMARSFRQLARSIFVCLLLAATGSVVAQTAASYPSKPVRMIIPYPPGGNGDVMSRMVSAWFSKNHVGNFLVDNRPGGDTIIGVDAVAKAVPDGYTLLAHSDALFANHWFRTDLPYDTLKDFKLITPMAMTESAILIYPGVPADNLKAFIAYAKANPMKLNAASGSPLNRLTLQRFANATGTQESFTIINYKGAAPSLTDLMAGRVHLFFSNLPSAKPLIRSGKVRGFAVSGSRRDTDLVDIPTFEESGVQGFQPSGPLQNMLLAPIKTPNDIVEKLNVQTGKALADPELNNIAAKLGINTLHMTLAESGKTFRDELERFGQLVRQAGLMPAGR